MNFLRSKAAVKAVCDGCWGRILEGDDVMIGVPAVFRWRVVMAHPDGHGGASCTGRIEKRLGMRTRPASPVRRRRAS